jgi:hypothetical protein
MPWRIVFTLLAGCGTGLVLSGPFAHKAGLPGLALAIGIAHTFVSVAVLFQFARDTEEMVV